MKNSILFVILAMFAFSIQAQTKYTAIIDQTTLPNAFNTNWCPVRYWKNDLSVRTAALPHSTATCPSDVLLNVDMIKELPPITYPLVGATKINNINNANPSCNYVPSIPINNDCFSYE